MKGRRSSDQNYAFGYPCEFLGNVLPRDKEVVSHAHFLRRQNTSLGVWKQNTPDKLVAKTVTSDLFAVWQKTEIPCYGITIVEDRVERLLGRAKNVLKVKPEKRNEAELAEIWGGLFDISLCPHRELKLCDCPNCISPHPQQCDCSCENKIPENWKDFLWDQRGSRQQSLAGIDRKKTKLDLERCEKENEKEREKEEERAAFSKQEQVDEKAPYDALVDSQGERLSQGLNLGDDDESGDSDWEEGGQAGLGGGHGGGAGDVREYNTLSLPRFSRELDRYKVSNRAGAKLGNALLKDLGVVTEENLQLLLCPQKIVRQRAKFGKLSAETHGAKPPPGLYHHN